jgi:hypothetical protein
VLLYILTGCAAVVATIIFGIGGIQYGRDMLAARIIQKALQPGDQVVWNEQNCEIKEMTPFVTSLIHGQTIEVIANARLLKRLVVVKQDLAEQPPSPRDSENKGMADTRACH